MSDPAPESGPWQPVAGIIREYRVPLLLGAASLVCIVISIVLAVKSLQITKPIRYTNVTMEGENKPLESIAVDVAGAVASPGVYRLPVGSRVADAIAVAGGLSGANEERIAKSLNQAAVLNDGTKLYIPAAGEGEVSGSETTHNNSFATSPSEKSQNYAPLLRQEGLSQNGAININTSTMAELDTLPGVGPVTAQKILDGRPYGSVEELAERKILKPSVYEKCKNRLTL
ncbi:hypothetical protein A2Z33_01755 [Candidatus Gottesmanbacteria bacterium RBG_16_52_11]|uniref:Soluble ligand binding domain-containing protein n=1 Tax=Candidatus Gottesmanbacteria bacterium RBG_16_52_11 TaxID=1798374 RepID=A0A1F5YR07_9BACT|nr:MAG: hypothetical protein A2Z33_01755 [Candidatus Gottesmanbacteria bacterium RBG_16_52_11]